jgi:hypothetical protein
MLIHFACGSVAGHRRAVFGLGGDGGGGGDQAEGQGGDHFGVHGKTPQKIKYGVGRRDPYRSGTSRSADR